MTSGVVIKTCAFCPLPLSLYCKTCREGLCCNCLADHFEKGTGGAHFVCLYRDRLAAKSIGKRCRKHMANICEDFCTICMQPVCSECMNGEFEVSHDTEHIQTMMGLNIKRMREDLRYLSTILTPIYRSIQNDIDCVIATRTGKIDMVKHVLAGNLNFPLRPSEYRPRYRHILRKFVKNLREFEINLPSKLLYVMLRVEVRANVIQKMSSELSDRLKNYEVLLSPYIYKNQSPVLAKLGSWDFFTRIQDRLLECCQELEISIRKCAIDLHQNTIEIPRVSSQIKTKTKMKIDKTEKEASIDEMFNDCSYFVLGNNGPLYVVTVLVFAHNDESRMHGITFQDFHGEIVFEGVTEVVTKKTPLHCAMTSTASDRFLLAVSNMLMEVNLADNTIKTLRRNEDWSYVDIAWTLSGALLTIEERKLPEFRQSEYKITRCDLNGNVLNILQYDSFSVFSPNKVQEGMLGDIYVIDKGPGVVLVLNSSGGIKHRLQGGKHHGDDRFRSSPCLLHADAYGNTVIYDKGSRTIQFTDRELKTLSQIKMKRNEKNELKGFCVDNDDRLVCLFKYTDEFEIHVYDYLQKKK